MNSTLQSFKKRDTGWTVDDNNKARSMIKQKRRDGSFRYTDEDIARYMGMTVKYVAMLRKSTPMRSATDRYLENKLIQNGDSRGKKKRRTAHDGQEETGISYHADAQGGG